MEYILLLVGFVLLIKGADFFVEGSSSLARILRIPSVIIGLTIVAMGTSAPEASVSINAALAGSNDIAISNVVGSNIFNGLVVVGVCAVLAAFQTNKDILKRDMPLNICVSAILCLMFLDGKLSRTEGILLLAGMVLYLCFMIRSALKNREPGAPSQPALHCRWSGSCYLWRRSGSRQSLYHCQELGRQSELYRSDDHRYRHLSARTGNFHCSYSQGRQQSGTGKCHWFQPVQYPVHSGYVIRHLSSACPG